MNPLLLILIIRRRIALAAVTRPMPDPERANAPQFVAPPAPE